MKSFILILIILVIVTSSIVYLFLDYYKQPMLPYIMLGFSTIIGLLSLFGLIKGVRKKQFHLDFAAIFLGSCLVSMSISQQTFLDLGQLNHYTQVEYILGMALIVIFASFQNEHIWEKPRSIISAIKKSDRKDS
jgi:hypothetical protein